MEINSKKIGIVIVNYNGEQYQNEALESICNSTYKNIEVIIVDSASKDNSIKFAKSKFDKVHYILENINVGVAKGNNIGIKYAISNLNCDYILLLNNDIVLDKDTIKYLIQYSNEKTITVPKIYYFDNKKMIWFAGGKIRYWRAGVSHFGNHEIDYGQYDKNKFIDYAPTCCMLLHKDIFKNVGYIDENTFMYYDDTDLCQRLIDNNYNIEYIPKAFMWHKVNSSTGSFFSKIALYYNTRNRLYFIKKYNNKFNLFHKISNRLYSFAYCIFILLFKKNGMVLLKAYKDFNNRIYGRVDDI